MTTPEQLKALVDPVVENLFKALDRKGAVIVMLSGQQEGGHDAFYVGYSGGTLSVRGLREAGGEALQNLLTFNMMVAPAKKA